MRLFFLGLIASLFFFSGCSKSSTTTTVLGNWVKKSEFDGSIRSEALAFSIGDSAYIGFGTDGTNQLKDLWVYNLAGDFWKDKKSIFAGYGRNSAVAFSIGNKGYIGTGSNGDKLLNDFWEYDPILNKWTQKANFPGTARLDAVGFGIGNYGYIGTGQDSAGITKDFYRYDPSNDSWLQIQSIGGSKRTGASAFIIDGRAYVCCGLNNGAMVSDFWMYDPTSGNWTEKNQIKNISTLSFDDNYAIVREFGSAFAINSKGYITNGINGSILSTTWEYDPTTDLWITKTAFEGTARFGAVTFSIGNRAFVTTGRSSSYRFDDCLEFKPNDTYNAND